MSEKLSVSSAVDGTLQFSDLKMDSAVLESQAQQAELHGNAQLSENLDRAAELVSVPDEQLLSIYEALRPHRSSFSELGELASYLDRQGAPRCASLVLEAAQFYRRRGLLR